VTSPLSIACPPKGFRCDINGLRAWAVAVVILYHFGISGFDGGFIGVDVFFVISGFLMTAIIVKGLEQHSFSLVSFYLARARRIVPALLGLCAVLLGAGYFIMLSPDYERLAKHTIAAIAFISNFTFWNEAGYFDVSSHDKWLLHTWSLSVEWQFYLVLPLLLWGAWRVRPGRETQVWVSLAGIAASLSLSVLLTAAHPNAAFFLLPTRAWEMLGGGLAFLLSGAIASAKQVQRWGEPIGLILIIGSVAAFDNGRVWPGWNAVVPVGGAMLVLLANRSTLLTANHVAQWIGDRSYSLYLWHWPVFVAISLFEAQSSPLIIAVAILATAVLADQSFRWIEIPGRRRLGQLGNGRAVAITALALGIVLAPAIVIDCNLGFAGRFPAIVEAAAQAAKDGNQRSGECHPEKGRISPSCVYGSGKVGVIAIGDSHLNATITALAEALAPRGVGVTEWSYSACAFVPGVKISPYGSLARKGKDFQCPEFIGWVEEKLDAMPAEIPVVLINRYAFAAFGYNEDNYPGNIPQVYFSRPYQQTTSEYLAEFADHITESACQLARKRTVYLMRPIPEMGISVPNILSRRLQFGLGYEVSIPIEDYRKRNEWVWAAQDAARDKCGVRILDPLPYLCTNDRCYGSKNSYPLYRDDDHLSESGNKLLVPMFQAISFD
jgi:peptidoglycan/LPS O-acetylase OafA/YrhL